jgi:thioredoxin-dependent peroxiredoxin
MSETVKLSIGDQAPDFVVVDSTGNKISLDNILKENKYLLLVFYPGDDTPGCTKQLCGVRDIYTEYQNLGVKVLGVNSAEADSHQKFINKYNFPFEILVDRDNQIRDKYGAIKNFFGKKITKRGVFLIDKNGIIKFIHWGQQDNQEILDLIQNN